jgi:predicted N-acyltransferase
MPDGSEAIAVRVVSRIAELPAAEWDLCAGANPFVSHAFLSALEDSGSATRETGWLPQHLVIAGRDGRLMGAVPLYLKSHSYGEYVFDWGWADAYERAGGSYYPKLQSCVPFTPVTGPRLLLHPASERPAVARALVAGMLELARRTQVSSLHVTFPSEAEWRELGEADFLLRTGLQYHWQNRGYGSFDDFLASLASRKRKAIKRERRAVAESGVRLRALTRAEIEPRHWDAFHRFYRATSDKKWGPSYLTREFFHRLGETMGERVVLIVAEWQGEPVGAALNLVGDEPEGGVLYGRNWGGVTCRRPPIAPTGSAIRRYAKPSPISSSASAAPSTRSRISWRASRRSERTGELSRQIRIDAANLDRLLMNRGCDPGHYDTRFRRRSERRRCDPVCMFVICPKDRQTEKSVGLY